MVDKEYYNDMLLESDEYLELVEKYKTKDVRLIAQLIIKEGEKYLSYFFLKKNMVSNVRFSSIIVTNIPIQI